MGDPHVYHDGALFADLSAALAAAKAAPSLADTLRVLDEIVHGRLPIADANQHRSLAFYILDMFRSLVVTADSGNAGR